MSLTASKVECLNALYLSMIAKPVKKLIMYTSTDPSFQSLAKSLKVFKSVTRNIDDVVDACWKKFQEKRAMVEPKEPRYLDNQKKLMTDQPSGSDRIKRSSFTFPLKSGYSPNKNKKYFALVLMAFLDGRQSTVSNEVVSRRRYSDTSIYNRTISTRFQYGLNNFIRTEGMVPNLLKSEYTFPILQRMMTQQLINKAFCDNKHVNMNYALDYRISRATKILEKRFGIHVARLMKPFPFKESTVNTVAKSACILNSKPNFCKLVNYEIFRSALSPVRRRSATFAAI